MDERAQKIISMRDDERNKSYNMKFLYQEFADLGYPVENQITQKTNSATDKSTVIRDPTAIQALEDGACGFIGAWLPRGRYFFDIRIRNPYIAEIPQVKWWVSKAVQVAHQEIEDSNFETQLQNTIKGAMGFGTGCLYSEWDYRNQCLNFADWHVSMFEFKQDSHRRPDCIILSYKRTARQLVDEYDEPGEKVLRDAEDYRNESKLYSVIRLIKPRTKRTYTFLDNINEPYEDIHVNETEILIMKESGFPRFPFAINRWEVGSTEKWGRGRGLLALSAIKDLQQKVKDYTECCNRLLRPSVLKRNIEGQLNMMPDGQIEVEDVNDVKPLNLTLPGAFPVSLEDIKEQRLLIQKFFYNDKFNNFNMLTGDRRTTTEIELRYKEGLRLLISPVARQQTELFDCVLSNVIPLLIEWGRIPPLPQELKGQTYSIEYQGELAMAMKEFQARGFERAITLMGQNMQAFPEMHDEINFDRAMPDILTTYGMKIEHLNTPEEKQELRQKRDQDKQQVQQLMALQAQGKAYKDTKDAPEEGSPAAKETANAA